VTDVSVMTIQNDNRKTSPTDQQLLTPAAHHRFTNSSENMPIISLQ